MGSLLLILALTTLAEDIKKCVSYTKVEFPEIRDEAFSVVLAVRGISMERQWNDASGKYSIKAKLVDYEDKGEFKVLTLEKQDGSRISLKDEKLDFSGRSRVRAAMNKLRQFCDTIDKRYEEKKSEAERATKKASKWEKFKSSTEFARLEAAHDAAAKRFENDIIASIPTNVRGVMETHHHLDKISKIKLFWRVGWLDAKNDKFRQFAKTMSIKDLKYFQVIANNYGDMMIVDDEDHRIIKYSELVEVFKDQIVKIAESEVRR